MKFSSIINRSRENIFGFLLVGLSFCVFLAFAQVAIAAHEHFSSPGDHGHEAYWSWADEPEDPVTVDYYIDSSKDQGMNAQQVNRVDDAASTWNSNNPRLTLNEVGSDPGSDGIHIFNTTLDGSGNTLGKTTNTFTTHQSPTFPDGTEWHKLIGSDLKMDDAENWYNGTGSPGSNEFDYWSVMLHEMGHSIGLGHADGSEPNSVMQPTISDGETTRSLSSTDQQVQTTLYGTPEPSTWIMFTLGFLLIFWLNRNRLGSPGVRN